MAGTARSWRTTALAQNAGDLWGQLAIPAASARMTLTAPASGTGKTPDATENTTNANTPTAVATSALIGSPTRSAQAAVSPASPRNRSSKIFGRANVVD